MNLKSSKKRSSPSQGELCKNLEENHIQTCGIHTLKRKIVREASSATHKKSAEQEIIKPSLFIKGLSFIRPFVFYSILLLFSLGVAEANCQGRFVNPLTDICWSCLFPMTIGGANVSGGGFEDTPNPSGFTCLCPRPPLNLPTPGVPISFWEPARLVDVTRTPYCLINMGGIQLAGGNRMQGRGSVAAKGHSGGLRRSFYQVHWYVYPVIYWLELLTDFACLERASFDVAYLTELDPLWNDEETGFILNPEAVLFGNPIAQAACAADCALASSGFPNDALFWCGGCQGSLYPFSGSIPAHVGGVQASLLATMKLMGKLHRQLMLHGTMGKEGQCQRYPMPIIKKTQYKTQMVYPFPTIGPSTGRGGCHPLGRSETLWASGKEFPYQGEDFGYLIWRKRSCCVM
ncbi:MAG: TraU family protein [Alphaproteobacteria bacterium]|nr:TraU family protein [Alphaproteobacteria bacterium]